MFKGINKDHLKKFYKRFPDDDGQLKSRLFGKDPEHRVSASFELIIHEIFLRANCKLRTHPEMDNTKDRPDFIVTSGSGEQFYLEATVAMGVSTELKNALGRVQKLKTLISNLGGEKHITFPRVYTFPENDREVQQYYKAVKLWYLNRGGEETFRFDINEFEYITCGILREKPRINISEFFFPEPKITKKLKKKSTKYKGSNLPIIIAIDAHRQSVLDIGGTPSNYLDAIYGNFDPTTGIPNPSNKYKIPKGILSPVSNTKISGIFLVTNFSFDRHEPSHVFWFPNPWARHPLKTFPLDLKPAHLHVGQHFHIKTINELFEVTARS